MSQIIEHRHSPCIAALSKQALGTAVLPKKEQGPRSQPQITTSTKVSAPSRTPERIATAGFGLTAPPPPKKGSKHVTIRPSHPGIAALGMPENLVKAVIPIRHTLSSPIMCGFPEHCVDRFIVHKNTVPAEAGLEHLPLDELSVFNAQADTLNSAGRRKPLGK